MGVSRQTSCYLVHAVSLSAPQSRNRRCRGKASPCHSDCLRLSSKPNAPCELHEAAWVGRVQDLRHGSQIFDTAAYWSENRCFDCSCQCCSWSHCAPSLYQVMPGRNNHAATLPRAHVSPRNNVQARGVHDDCNSFSQFQSTNCVYQVARCDS